MDSMLAFAAALPERTVATDETLIVEGDHSVPLFVLKEGSLVIEHAGTAFATVNTPGAIFGEMSAVMGQPATATVRAAAPCRVHVAEDAIQFLSDTPGAALAALRIAAGRIDNLTKYLTDVKSQYASETGHLGMVDGVLNALVHHQAGPVQTGSAREPDPDY